MTDITFVMTKMVSKLLHAIIVILFLVSGFSTHAEEFSAVNRAGDTIYYRILSSSPATVCVTYRGTSPEIHRNDYSGVVDIPATVVLHDTTYRVTSIGNRAFEGCSGLTAVSLPSSVTSIGEYAFSGCTNLTEIAIPSGVATIGHSAFFGCSNLSSVVISSNSVLTAIEHFVFTGCRHLTSIAIPASVTSIEYNAFLNCSRLASVHLPSNSALTTISSSAFENCSNLISITLPPSVTSIGNAVFSYCSSLSSVDIPSHSALTSIGHTAFFCCSNLATVAIPASVTTIGNAAFKDCSSLDTVTIASSCVLPKNLFDGCSIRHLTFLQDVQTLPSEKWQTDTLAPKDTVASVAANADTLSPDRLAWHVQAEGIKLIIQGAEGKTLHIYDAWGVLMRSITRAKATEHCKMPGAGLYIVSVEGGESKRITLQK